MSVLVVNDGSTDDTEKVAKDHGAQIINHVTSVGLGTVFQEEVARAIEQNFDIMLTIDGDGQFSEDDIPSLLQPIINDTADFVTGSRFQSSSTVTDMPHAKRWGNTVVSFMVSSILKRKYKDVSCGFRVYNRKSLCHLNLSGGFTYTQEVFLNLGYKNMRIVETPITVKYFADRRSRIAHSLFNYGQQVSKIMLSSILFYRPLRFFGTIALIHFIVGFPIVITLGIRYHLTGLITPYKAIALIGVILVVFSVLYIIVGLFMQSVSRLQMSIDRMLYHQKYGKK